MLKSVKVRITSRKRGVQKTPNVRSVQLKEIVTLKNVLSRHFAKGDNFCR